MTTLERLSIELSNRCDKACWFCYAGSEPAGPSTWTVDELVELIADCAANGLRAVSFGGGEPLQWPGVFELLERTRGLAVGGAGVGVGVGVGVDLFRSLTTNGLALEHPDVLEQLVAARPDKVHVSIHFPGSEAEVERVVAMVDRLATIGAATGLRSGINLLVRRSGLADARAAAERIAAAGIDRRRVVFLPMRGMDTPSAPEVADVAGVDPGQPFASMSCLSACAISPRFCSLSWRREVGWCSYTREREPLAEPSFAALREALRDLGLRYCGGSPEDPRPRLIGLPRASSRAGSG